MDKDKKNGPSKDTDKPLKDLNISINKFGELTYNLPLDEINEHLDANVPDKKFTQQQEEE